MFQIPKLNIQDGNQKAYLFLTNRDGLRLYLGNIFQDMSGF